MDEKLMPYVKRPENLSLSIMEALRSAVLEWFLIFLLFIDASFGYFVTKFARYCNLQSPCLLCSRLDHILGNEKTGFYWDLICEKHKSKISSLVTCHLHSNLVDVHGLCETCLFSFATVNKSNTETYRLLVGKLGSDSLLGHEHIDDDSSDSKICSCCNEQWISRDYFTKLFRSKSIVSEGVEMDGDDLKMVSDDTYCASKGVEQDEDDLMIVKDDTYQASKGIELEFNIPLPVSVGGEMIIEDAYIVSKSNGVDPSLSVTNGDDLKTYQVSKEVEHDSLLSNENDFKIVKDETNRVDKVNEPLDVTNRDNLETYQVVKEFEFDSSLISTIDHDNNKSKMVINETSHVEKGNKLDAPLDITNGDYPEMIKEDVEHDSPLITTVDHNENDSKMVKDEVEFDTPLSVSVEHDEDYLNLKSTELDSHEGQNVVMVKDETYRAGKVSPSSMSNFDPLPHVEYTMVKISSDSESESEAHFSDNESPKKHFSIIPEPRSITLVDNTVLEKLINPASLPEHLQITNTHFPTPPPTPLYALPELISFDEVIPLSSDILNVRGEKEEVEDVKETIHAKVDIGETSTQLPNSLELGDAYKLALGSRGRQLSGKFLEQTSLKETTRPSEDFKLLLTQLSSSMSPREDGNSSSMKILQKRISLERNESGLSLDSGSVISEIEGESVVDRLKRQVEQDKRLMSVLYQELEDERNASAVAVNQAMAMITRLQEEKAALQMEALQCLRMMEDQAEFDVEALQYSNDLVALKDKEIQDLRDKLQLYKERFGDTVLGEIGEEDTQ